MIKITGGTYKGRMLASPKNKNIRPTPSMVRAAIFDIISNHWNYSSFLDLFAGTGTMGFEALSRGAETVYFVDKSGVSCSIIRKNSESLNVQDSVRIFNKDAAKALAVFKRKNIKFSLIFIDPPYKNVVLRDFVLSEAASVLTPDGLLLVEYSGEYAPPPESLETIELFKKRNWGETFINFYVLKQQD